MRATKSKDGKRRVTLNLSFRLDAEMLATLVTSSASPDRSDDPAAFAGIQIARGERALLNEARDEIERSGIEVPSYRVGDQHLTAHAEALAAELRRTFSLD